MIITILIHFLFCINAYDKLDKVNVLYVGESKIIDGNNIKKITVANSRIIKVTKSGKFDLLINAKRKGSSDIKIINKDGQMSGYSFIVISSEVYQRVVGIRTALSSIKGIKVSNAGEDVYITGSIEKTEEQDLVNKIVSSHKKVFNYAKLSSMLQIQRTKSITDDIIELGIYDANIKEVAGILYIKGNVRNQEQLKDINHYIKLKHPNAVVDISLIPYQVDIDVKIIEVSNSTAGKLGFDIPTQYNVTKHTVFSKVEIDSILNLETKKGRIKILANPSLSSNNEEKAVFHAGGSVPIKLSSRFSSSVEWKNYGVMLDFIPKVVNDNTVKLSIKSEFSSKETSSSDSDVPGFSVRKVSTVVTVDSGRSVVISGLIQKMSLKANSGLPILSEIPVISDIFSLNENEDSNSELAIIVTPSIRFRCEGFALDKELEDLLVETLGEEIKQE